MPCQFFISDLHLDLEARPGTVRLFERFLADVPDPGDAVFILGDLFELWVCDCDESPLAQRCKAALRACSDRGCKLYLQRGNRDFLLGSGDFLEVTGMRLLPETYVTEVAGQPTLLLHGDLLCTDDEEYQRWRRFAQHPLTIRTWQFIPLALQRRLGQRIRRKSQHAGTRKAAAITDVNPQTVIAFFEQHGVRRMIHGHTHRPARHEHPLPGGNTGLRYVLDEWHPDHASYLVDDGSSLQARPLPAVG